MPLDDGKKGIGYPMRESVKSRRLTAIWLNAPAVLLCFVSLFWIGSAKGRSQQLKTPPKLEPSPPTFDVALEEAWIPLADGVRLAADLWRPKGPGDRGKFPVLLEYLPYRKTESRGGSYSLYAWFVRRGYVVARVDIRGTGNSEGTLIPYEYSEIEQRDGEEVIAWLARQPFSNGNVGMFGISWGGFNSIHMAMRNPPALKAIIAACATDDLYQDDVHFIDGMLHVDTWEMSQDLDNARPGAPDYRIDERYFAERFDTPPWMLTYKPQQRDGPFWDRTALKTRYDSIRIPTFLIGGWYDGYRDSIPRMLEHLKAPVKAIIGPWNHTYPSDPYPKPGMEWRHEAVRWFDQWLKGRNTGIMDEPRFAVYVQQWHPPGPYLEEAPGEWRYEDGWPIKRIQEKILYPRPDRTLGEAPAQECVDLLRYVPTTGIEPGGPVLWFGDVAADQRPADAFSLVYDTQPLDRDVEILGLPRARLRVSADAPLAHWFVRLNDVAPDGTVTLVASAGFNGAHRESVFPGHRDALHVLGFPKGTPDEARRREHPVADDLDNALPDDDIALPRRGRRDSADAAGRPPGRTSAAFFPPASGQRAFSPRIRTAGVRNRFRLWRDLLNRPEPPAAHDPGHRHERKRRALSLGRRALHREVRP
jgi:putative CocE/NonD family hydrolase